MSKLHVDDPTANTPFKNSVYPAACMNAGPQTCCKPHFDVCNYPGSPCAVTAFGHFNPDTGGHFVLYDLKLFFRFPPGTTVLLSSAGIRHGNTPISPEETRYSFTQFCPGGLMRWVAYGCKPAGQFSKKDRENMDKQAEEGWEKQLGRFSKIWELDDDRERVWNQEHAVRE
jgi:hypothetical protein